MNTFLNKETKIRLFYFIAAHFWQKKIFFQKTTVISKKVRKIAHFFVDWVKNHKWHTIIPKKRSYRDNKFDQK